MNEILTYIINRIPQAKPFVLGVDGGLGAGKSTIVEEIRKELNRLELQVAVLHIDDFIHQKSVRYNESVEEWYSFYKLQWRYDYLIEEILQPLQVYGEVDKMIELYNKKNDIYDIAPLSINGQTIVILEGVFIQRNEIAPFLDYVIYLDIPRNKRLEKVLKRDTHIGNSSEIEKKYSQRYFLAEDAYNRECNPALSANLVFTNYFKL